ncbi:riboflavin synthase [Alphaproteobacteria bacterium LSUCC0684]
MFTGIIAALGEVALLEKKPDGGCRVEISTPWNCDDIDLGASIACSGVCLTVVERDGPCFAVDVSEESLAVTTLSGWNVGRKINLERALAMGDELGGHLVSGHVDGLAELVSITPDGDSYRLFLDAPHELAHLIAPKGSVALDGISLTVNSVEGRRFGVMIIPHTWEMTTLSLARSGDKINLEADMFARYVARIVSYTG